MALGVERREKFEIPNIWYFKSKKKMLKNQGLFPITGYSLNNRPEWAENAPGWHHAPKYNRFPDIPLQFSLAWPNLKNGFL